MLFLNRKVIPVVIPYFNNGHNKGKFQLKRCLKHLKKQTIKVKPIIVDDTYTCRRFTRTVNDGITKCEKLNYDNIIILNQDMYLYPDAVAKMINFMDFYHKCGICVPLQLHRNDENFVINAGTFEAWPHGRHEQGPKGSFDTSQIYWANGTCMTIRRDVIRDIGLLDENFKLICSDSDYSYTAKSRGWQIWRIRDAYGIHDCGVSMNSTSYSLAIMKINDMLHFAKKWITGELYRSISYEGITLTADFVIDVIKEQEEKIQEFKKKL